MKKEKKPKNKLRRLLITCGVLAVILIAMVCLRQSVKASVFLQKTLSRAIIWLSGHIFGWIPFSVYELFLYVIIITGITCLVHIIIRLFKRRWKKAATTAVSVALIALTFGTVYFASAGFAYAKIETSGSAIQPQMSNEQVLAMSEYFFNDFNELSIKLENELGRDKDGNLNSPYTDRQLSKKLQQEYARPDVIEYARLNIKELNKYTPNCKSILSSRIMSEMRICGVFFAPFGEANINRDMPAVEKPYTMAHEMAHSKGVMREDDADTIAAYLTLTSDDDFIRYSGYLDNAETLFDTLWQYKEYTEYSERKVSRAQPILNDYKSIGLFWGQYNLWGGVISDLTEKFNDSQLQIMGQEEGTDAYNPSVDNEEHPEIDPETGEEKVDENGEKIYYYNYTALQMVYFSIADEVLKRDG